MGELKHCQMHSSRLAGPRFSAGGGQHHNQEVGVEVEVEVGGKNNNNNETIIILA
jgi:hypothetical protein